MKTLLHINSKMVYIPFIYPFNSFAMLAAAPRLVSDLNWLALLAGLVLVMKTYWLALFTGRASAPKTTDI